MSEPRSHDRRGPESAPERTGGSPPPRTSLPRARTRRRPGPREDILRLGREARQAAALAAGSVQRSELWRRSRVRAGRASKAAAATGRTAAQAAAAASAAAARHGRDAYAASSRLPGESRGAPRRPWEIRTAAILGLIAPLFVVAAIIAMAVSGGRTLRSVEWMLRGIGDSTGQEAISTAADVSAGLADALVVLGVVVGLVVVAAFGVYSWRVLVGRGHARWAALIALVVSLLVLTPLSPMLTSGFQVFAVASLVLAFLPRSAAWFRYRRERVRLRRR